MVGFPQGLKKNKKTKCTVSYSASAGGTDNNHARVPETRPGLVKRSQQESGKSSNRRQIIVTNSLLMSGKKLEKGRGRGSF